MHWAVDVYKRQGRNRSFWENIYLTGSLSDRTEINFMHNINHSRLNSVSENISEMCIRDSRFPVQYVLRPNLDFRGFCGKIASGVIHKGDEVMALPSGKKSHIKSIVTYDGELELSLIHI